MFVKLLTTAFFVFQVSLAYAASGVAGSGVGGGGDCLDVVAGQSVDALVEEAGGIEPLLNITIQQIAEIDVWKVEMEKVMNQGIKEQEIKDAYNQGLEFRAANVELQEALECRLGS